MQTTTDVPLARLGGVSTVFDQVAGEEQRIVHNADVVGPGRHYPPRHPPRVRPSIHKLSDIA